MFIGVSDGPNRLKVNFSPFVITEPYEEMSDDCMKISIDYMLRDGCLKSQSASSVMARHGGYAILWWSIAPSSFIIALGFCHCIQNQWQKRPLVSATWPPWLKGSHWKHSAHLNGWVRPPDMSRRYTDRFSSVLGTTMLWPLFGSCVWIPSCSLVTADLILFIVS